MAKGFKKGGIDILVWEVFRGAGRQLGRDLSTGAQRQIKKKVLDDQSSHRKMISKFALPGTFKAGMAKMYTLIDSFYSEYITTNAMFQASFYLQNDIDFIEQKIEFLDRLITTEAEERAYDRLISTWAEYKQNAKVK